MIFPIQVYTKEDCTHCATLKTELKALNVPFLEYELGKDVSVAWFKENFKGKGLLPVVVTEDGVYSGPIEIGHLLSEYKSETGKRLLNEDYSGEFSYD